MKTKLFLPFLGIACMISTATFAQDDAPTSKPSAFAPYKTSVGLRYTTSGRYGSDLTLVAKRFITQESAIEAQVGIANYNRGYYASLQYLWQPQLLTSQRLRPYAGIGLGITGTEFNNYGEKQELSTNLIGLSSIGIEYTFPKIPLSLTLDYRHAFFGFKTDNIKDLPINRLNNVALGLKYSFR